MRDRSRLIRAGSIEVSSRRICAEVRTSMRAERSERRQLRMIEADARQIAKVDGRASHPPPGGPAERTSCQSERVEDEAAAVEDEEDVGLAWLLRRSYGIP